MYLDVAAGRGWAGLAPSAGLRGSDGLGSERSALLSRAPMQAARAHASTERSLWRKASCCLVVEILESMLMFVHVYKKILAYKVSN